MFQTVAIIVLLATLIGIALHCLAFPARAKSGAGVIPRIVHAFSLLLIEQERSLLGALKKLCYLVTAVCFVVLAITGFWPTLVHGEHISGFPIMIHSTFAAVFAICLAIITLTWGGANRFERSECPWLWRLLRQVTNLRVPMPEGPCRCTVVVRKAMFWAIVGLSLPLILSIVLSMLHLFGTHWQEILLAIHRWTALVFAVAVILHTYTAARSQMGQ
jgi:cytochrome b subunit of formate dehydrogenase